MNTKAVIAALVIAGAGYHFWSQHQEANQQQAVLDSADASGFIALPPAAGVDPDKVLILAAPNCPKAGAQRAAALAEALAARGIPFVQSGHISFKASPDHIPDRKRMDSVMLGPTPVVLIHGRGRANPSLEDVLAEYSGGNDV
ncbi:MAG TPA: hypothetical protein VKA50_02945 [Gammaproteobacteria bacterium]|nr:hypothetical protein [Gammaproteobacteria bacterium]